MAALRRPASIPVAIPPRLVGMQAAVSCNRCWPKGPRVCCYIVGPKVAGRVHTCRSMPTSAGSGSYSLGTPAGDLEETKLKCTFWLPFLELLVPALRAHASRCIPQYLGRDVQTKETPAHLNSNASVPLLSVPFSGLRSDATEQRENDEAALVTVSTCKELCLTFDLPTTQGIECATKARLIPNTHLPKFMSGSPSADGCTVHYCKVCAFLACPSRAIVLTQSLHAHSVTSMKLHSTRFGWCCSFHGNA